VRHAGSPLAWLTETIPDATPPITSLLAPKQRVPELAALDGLGLPSAVAALTATRDLDWRCRTGKVLDRAASRGPLARVPWLARTVQ
jgi:hypothetical protein